MTLAHQPFVLFACKGIVLLFIKGFSGGGGAHSFGGGLRGGNRCEMPAMGRAGLGGEGGSGRIRGSDSDAVDHVQKDF